MKVQAFLNVLRPYADIVAQSDKRLAERISTLADIWASNMSWNVKDLLSRAWPAAPVVAADEFTVQEFREALIRLQKVMEPIAKQDFLKDLSAVVGALEPHDQQDLAFFIEACRQALNSAQLAGGKKKVSKSVNETLVSKIVEELRNAYKDAGRFGPLYERLAADNAVTQGDMAAIASQVAYKTPASTKRAESLRRIGVVHESYAASAAKSEAGGGKSAA